MSFPLSFCFLYSFGSEPIEFPFKMVLCKFCLDLPLFGLGTLELLHLGSLNHKLSFELLFFLSLFLV